MQHRTAVLKNGHPHACQRATSGQSLFSWLQVVHFDTPRGLTVECMAIRQDSRVQGREECVAMALSGGMGNYRHLWRIASPAAVGPSWEGAQGASLAKGKCTSV